MSPHIDSWQLKRSFTEEVLKTGTGYGREFIFTLVMLEKGTRILELGRAARGVSNDSAHYFDALLSCAPPPPPFPSLEKFLQIGKTSFTTCVQMRPVGLAVLAENRQPWLVFFRRRFLHL